MNAHGLTTWIRLATSIGAVAFVACGDKGPPNIPQEEASETVADTVCEQADSCGCFSGGEDTLDSCTSQYESEVQQMIDAGEAAGLNYDGKCVGELLQAQQDLGCATEYEEDDFDCQPCKFFYGPKQLGEPCDEPGDDVFGDECAQGLYCSDTGCVDPCVLGDEGDDCSAGGCKDGLECH
jgi:hypothetical protein